MTPDQAAWVRQHAWTPKMRRCLWATPGAGSTYDPVLAASRCDCATGVCGPCRAGRHGFCDRRMIRPRPEWWITNRPLDHITPTAVWHADRTCRSLCPCDCPAPKPVYEVVPLPGLELVGAAT